jgi:hypothetical protein
MTPYDDICARIAALDVRWTVTSDGAIRLAAETNVCPMARLAGLTVSSAMHDEFARAAGVTMHQLRTMIRAADGLTHGKVREQLLVACGLASRSPGP